MRVMTSHPHTPRRHDQRFGDHPDDHAAAGACTPDAHTRPARPGRRPYQAAPARDSSPTEPATEPGAGVPTWRGLGWRVWARGCAGVATLLAGLTVVVALLSWVNVGLAHAADAGEVIVLAQSGTSGEVNKLLDNATKWLIGILAAAATLFLTIGAVRYIFANGNPSELEHAKSALRNAGIGYALAALAPLIVRILQELLPEQTR